MISVKSGFDPGLDVRISAYLALSEAIIGAIQINSHTANKIPPTRSLAMNLHTIQVYLREQGVDGWL